MNEGQSLVERADSASELSAIYKKRFRGLTKYRRKVWETLTARFFQSFIPEDSVVVDLGCGYGEFINSIRARTRYGIDLNEDACVHLNSGIEHIRHDATLPWPIPRESVDIVFTSNFFEHLPSKSDLMAVFQSAFAALKPGGRLIAVGPNIRFLAGEYWDFWDHHIPLSERSVSEGLTVAGFEIERMNAKFLPYTMSGKIRPPVILLRVYLKIPILWGIFGRQFLVVARKGVTDLKD